MQADALLDDLASLWGRVTEQLEAGLPSSTFRLWIAPLQPVSVQGNTLCVAAPAATCAWVRRRYANSLEAALRAQATGLEHLVVLPGPSAPGPPEGEWTTSVESLPVEERHTFERFVIGDGNRLAHAAALAVAELPGEAYNPLFLHGRPGLGKTHLLGAIIHYLRRHRPDLTPHYTTAERFTTEFVAALRRNGPELFKQRYRKLDALLIDDVQTLEGKEQTQEEFVHTFNALHGSGKQIVLSSDRPPEALGRLAERLRDRFQWGLCAPLASPDLRTRTSLLWRLAADSPTPTEPAAIRELAGRATANVRRLEGALTRVLAISSVLGKPVTADLVRQALGDRHSSGREPSADRPPSATAIQRAACSALGVSHQDLLSPSRTARVTRARQIAIYLTRELTSLSLAQIAREFNRDHSTVLHAIRSIGARLEPGSELSTVLERTRAQLEAPDSSTPLLHDPAAPSHSHSRPEDAISHP